MKNFKFLITLLFLAQLSAIQVGQCHELNKGTEKLTPAENAAVLEDIDSICGDTWCEGDFNFSFDRLSCPVGKKECLLDLTFINYDEDGIDTDQKFAVACAITGMETKEDIMVINGLGRVSYSQKLYDGIGQCISLHNQAARDYFNDLP